MGINEQMKKNLGKLSAERLAELEETIAALKLESGAGKGSGGDAGKQIDAMAKEIEKLKKLISSKQDKGETIDQDILDTLVSIQSKQKEIEEKHSVSVKTGDKDSKSWWDELFED